MDDYVSKPIQPSSLIEVIARWIDNEGVRKPEPPSAASPRAKEIFDKEMVMERLDGDETFFRELLGMFLDDVPIQLERMQNQLKEEDFGALERQAHTLKGAAMSLGGMGLQKAALELEVAARNHEPDRASILLGSFEKEFAEFGKAVAAGMQDGQEDRREA